jgi:hypothetical protein
MVNVFGWASHATNMPNAGIGTSVLQVTTMSRTSTTMINSLHGNDANNSFDAAQG